MASKKTKIICAALCALWLVLLIVSYVLPKEEAPAKPEAEIVNCFVGAAPITISGSIVQYRNYSLLKMNLHNRDTTPVSALKVFIRCYSAYDNEITDGAPCHVIYEQYKIQPDGTNATEYRIPSYTKKVEISLYSVYYFDQIKPEWGDRKATREQIDLYAPKTVIKYDR